MVLWCHFARLWIVVGTGIVDDMVTAWTFILAEGYILIYYIIKY